MSISSQPNTASIRSDAHSRETSISNLNSSYTSPSETSPLRPCISRGETCGPRLEYQTKSDHRSFVAGEDDESASVEWIEYIDPTDLAEDDNFGSIIDEYVRDGDHQEFHQNDAFPATSREFASLFPSSRRLEIRHDDTTIDGNMNLRIDTTLCLSKKHTRKLTLFHLRMQDLRRREFSLRRYCRDSGREICRCSKKQPHVPENQTLTGSLSNVFASFRPPTPSKLKRQDSGYGSMGEDESQWSKYSGFEGLSDIISLEFSNYAHLDLKRRGFAAAKRYDFEYWGVSYSWKRISRKAFGHTDVSYHLLRRSDKRLVAHVVPVPLTDDEAKDEADAGGWVPPCSMWLSDKGVMDERTGISDVVIATGLLVLADDSIRTRFQAKAKTHFNLPQFLRSPFHAALDQIGSKTPVNSVARLKPSLGLRRHSQ